MACQRTKWTKCSFEKHLECFLVCHLEQFLSKKKCIWENVGILVKMIDLATMTEVSHIIPWPNKHLLDQSTPLVSWECSSGLRYVKRDAINLTTLRGKTKLWCYFSSEDEKQWTHYFCQRQSLRPTYFLISSHRVVHLLRVVISSTQGS